MARFPTYRIIDKGGVFSCLINKLSIDFLFKELGSITSQGLGAFGLEVIGK
jgi:hypothetical protein